MVRVPACGPIKAGAVALALAGCAPAPVAPPAGPLPLPETADPGPATLSPRPGGGREVSYPNGCRIVLDAAGATVESLPVCTPRQRAIAPDERA